MKETSSDTHKSSVLFDRLWNSPTLATWGSFVARSLSLIVVLPLVLTRLTAGEFAVYLMFSTIASLQSLAELGFGATFTRILGYAMGGGGIFKQGTAHSNPNEKETPLIRIVATMRYIYRRLEVLLGGLLAVGGTAALWGPISRCENPVTAWLAWLLVYCVTILSFHSTQYANLLQGTNHIALLRRWETAFAIGSIVSVVVATWAFGGLLVIMASHQMWIVMAAIRNRRLACWALAGECAVYPSPKLDSDIYNTVWPSAWRSGIGVAMSFGLVQISALFHAQSKDLNSVNSYLLGLRLVQMISQFSQAPFYSKLPGLARLYSEGRIAEMVELAKRGMKLSYWSFVFPIICLGIFGPYLLRKIGSSASFPSAVIWLSLSGAILAERYGAMHLQLFSATNRIIWHFVNGVTGAIVCCAWIVLYPTYGALGLSLGLLFGYLSFYAWYSSYRSHREFNLPFPMFDLQCGKWPISIFFGGAIVILMLNSFNPN